MIWKRYFTPIEVVVSDEGDVAILGDWRAWWDPQPDRAVVVYDRQGHPGHQWALTDLLPPLLLESLGDYVRQDEQPWSHYWLADGHLVLHHSGDSLLVIDIRTGRLSEGGKSEVLASQTASALRLTRLWDLREASPNSRN